MVGQGQVLRSIGHTKATFSADHGEALAVTWRRVCQHECLHWMLICVGELKKGCKETSCGSTICGIIRICLRRREGYLSTTTITITSKLKEFKVARVVLQKINVADDIVCWSSPNWQAGQAGQAGPAAGIDGRGGLCCGLLTEGRRSRDEGGGSVGWD